MHPRRGQAPYVTHLECAACGRAHAADREQHLCPCGGPLWVRYDLPRLAAALRREDLAAREASPWRYGELLPLTDPDRAARLGEGWTPLLPLRRWGRRRGLRRVLLKDEGRNPTGTFKCRGAAVGVSRARELGARTVVLASAGNAGGAWAAYAARAGLHCVVVMPRDAPAAAVAECRLAGARVEWVDGTLADAAREAAARGWYDASTLREPYRVEGKKTMGLELAEQLGWRLPDVVVYPCGGGVGLLGIYKAWAELRALGWVRPAWPRLVAVQPEGCCPIVRAWEAGAASAQPFAGARTVAAGLRVPKALGDFLVLRALRETGGCAVSVDDAAILRAQRELAAEEGLWVSPEGAAALAGLERLRAEGAVDRDACVVVINTGSGLKYPELWCDGSGGVP